VIVAGHLVEYTDHRVVAILQGLRGRGPPRPGHGMVGLGATPFRRGILTGVRPWEVGRKAHCRTWDLFGIEVVPSVVGFALSKVAVWNAWLHGTNKWIVVARHSVEYTDHRVVTILQGLRGRSPPRPSHGMVGAITRDRVSSRSVVAISRSSTYGGLIPVDALLFLSDQAVRKRRLGHTVV
jgi:hypothetical protein